MNIFIEKFGGQKRWVIYKLEKVGGKITKVPYSINGSKASSIDYSTWSTYEDCKKVSDNVGIMFGNKKTLLGVDIDKVMKDNVIVHEDKEKILKFITEADTYCEISPSGTGFHLFFEMEEGFDLKANRKGIYECYTTGRYFTFTGNVYGIEKPVRKISIKVAEEILSIIGYPWNKDETKKIEKPIHFEDSLDDDILLEKIFGAINGKEVKALYDGDITKYNNDQSSADMALCSHLAYWTRKDPSQMERIWLGSPLGMRMKTASRKDYRDRTISNAIKNCTQIYTNPGKETIEQVKELDLLNTIGAKGVVKITQCTENIVRILHGNPEFKGTIKFDEFKNVLYIKDKQMEDHDVLYIQTRIQVLYPDLSKVSKDMVYDAMMKVAHDNTFDSAKEYLLSLKWDGEKRVDNWLTMTYHTPNDIYHRTVGANWLKGLVKRIMIPGCKFDHVLVLEGEQGIKKSTSLMVLGRDWHVETTMSTDNKDFFMMFQGKAIIEFSEGETLNRTEVKRMKAIITTQSDKYRPAYGRLSVDYPRRCVFAMTTNADEYLKDETGNRRWLPVKCMGVADVEWLEQNRDQLFAEAYQRVMVDQETTWEFPEEEMKAEQDKRRIHDPWEDIILEWYYSLSESDKMMGVAVQDVWEKAINKGSYSVKPIQRFEEMNIGDVLKRILKLEKRRSVLNGQRASRYFPPDAPEITMEVERSRPVVKDNLSEFVKEMKTPNNLPLDEF